MVLVRVNGKQLLVLAEALPGLRIDGETQCHIVAVAKQQGEVAVSVGCVLSRTRTGMRSQEMTYAIPASRLQHVVARVQATAATDAIVASYASGGRPPFRRRLGLTSWPPRSTGWCPPRGR